MTFFDNLKVSFKLGLLILIALLSLGLVGFTGYFYLQQSSQEMNTLYTDRLIPVQLLNESRANINRMNSALLELMLTTDNKKNQDLKNIINDRRAKLDNNFAIIEKSHMDPKAIELTNTVKNALQNYHTLSQHSLSLALQNKNTEAYDLYTKEVDQAATQSIDNLRILAEYYTKLSDKANIDNRSAAQTASLITIGILLLSFLLLVTSGFYISRLITKPLSNMVSVCQEFAGGDFRDKPRTIIRKDEIGQLADAMFSMKESLRKLMKQVQNSSEQLAAASEELTASAEQSSLAATQIAESITHVASGAENQLQASTNTSAVVQQISASIQQVSAKANQAADQSLQTTETATAGNESVGKAVLQMHSIEQTVLSSAQVVEKLGDRSKEIGQIVDTISGIAGQTNLLALNAAIEAARAGEQGRGFAVVAEEVRKLAEQSQDAAKQISALISEIQSDTEKAVVAMNDGTREVKLGAEIVNASGESFKEITERIQHVSNQARDISSAIEQMALGSQQIIESVKQIDSLSKKASSETQNVSAATEEQSASMEQIAASSQSLAKLATDLSGAVGRFQL